MRIWGIAESKAWANVLNALFTETLPRSKIAEYIRESDVFHDRDPEEVMKSLEDGQAKFKLYQKAISKDTESLLKCSFIRGMMTKAYYMGLLEISKMCDENEDCY